jgi:hypothetical protein
VKVGDDRLVMTTISAFAHFVFGSLAAMAKAWAKMDIRLVTARIGGLPRWLLTPRPSQIPYVNLIRLVSPREGCRLPLNRRAPPGMTKLAQVNGDELPPTLHPLQQSAPSGASVLSASRLDPPAPSAALHCAMLSTTNLAEPIATWLSCK